MKKVIAVGSYGNITSAEDIVKLHNDLVYEMFKEVLEPIKEEKVEGDIIQFWNNAGLITKYLGTMFYLEDIKEDEMVNSVVCIIPKDITTSQLEYFENNYLNSIDTFIGVSFEGDKFSLSSDKSLDSTGIYNVLKDKMNHKTKS